MREEENRLKEEASAVLAAFGVPQAAEDPLLEVALQRVRDRLRNETNRDQIPEELIGMGARMTAGEYLRMKKVCGTLEGFDLEAAVKQIQEGDTNTVFAIGDGSATPEQRLDSLIECLIEDKNQELYRYRRIAW